MRHILTLPLTLFAVATLAACNNSSPQTFNDTIGDPMASELAQADSVKLPPAVKASDTYRCKDNSLVYIDFFADDLTANIRTKEDAPPVKLTAPEKGQPFEADGYKIEGSGKEVTVTTPDKAAQSCKA